MILSADQIKAAVNGIVRTEENELGLELHRFTRDQEAFFYRTHPVFCRQSFFNGYFGRNCRTCAGVTLDFVTNAKTVKIEFGKIEYPEGEKDQLFDLWVNDELVQSYALQEQIAYKAPDGTYRFTLYFPHFAFPIISSVVLEDATVYLPQKKQIDILFLGDSITHGARALHPTNTYVMQTAKRMEVGILNQGNSGFVYDAGSIEKICDPKIIVTAYGINDFYRKDIPAIENDTTKFLQKLRKVYGDAKIVSILPLWTKGTKKDPDYKKAERDCLISLYTQYSDYMLDGRSLMPYNEAFYVDAVHPKDAGFLVYGENLAKELVAILKREEGRL